MVWLKIGLGTLIALVGLVWIGQGLNLIHGSGMSGKPAFSVLGLVLVVGGVFLLMLGIRGYRRA